jgi:hypothetical protein
MSDNFKTHNGLMRKCSREIADELLAQDLTPVPVAFRGKNPTVTGWQTYTHGRVIGEIDRLFPAGRKLNVGCLLGAASGGIVDIDLDWLLAGQLAPMFLPATRMFGRVGAPGSHYLYFAEGDVTSTKLSPPRKPPDGFKPDILEVRSTGLQTVWPGSTHITGEAIEWANPDVPITRIKAEELVLVAEQLAVATWVASVWGEGSRDELCAALAGGILRDGAKEADVTHFLAAVMTVATDEEARDRLKKVCRIAGDLAGGSGKKHYGWPKVAELLGSKEADWIRKYLRSMCPTPTSGACAAGLDSAVVTEMLDNLAVVKHGSQTYILYPELDVVLSRPDAPRKRFDLVRAPELVTLYANRRVVIPGRNGPQLVDPVKLFLEHSDRKTYFGIVFAPDGKCPGGYLNLWQGFTVEPKPGDCGLYLAHIRDNIAAGNVEHSNWIVGWMADAVQNPSMKPGTALILRGGRGTGKGMMVKWFGRLFGQHFLPISKPGLVTGRFTGHLADASIVFADEAFFAGNKAEEAALKALITEDFHMIEYKGKDAVTVRNLIRLVAASNHDWAVPAGLDERRFGVFDVADHKQQDHQYFGAIEQQMTDGGLPALLDYLLNFDLKTVDIKKAPSTEALAENKLLTAEPVVKWWHNTLYEGHLTIKDSGFPDYTIPLEEGARVRTRVLWESFRDYARDQRHCQARESMVIFGNGLRSVCPKVKRTKYRFGGGEPEWVYKLPPLTTCMVDFVGATGITVDRPESEGDDGGGPEVRPQTEF